MQQTVRQHFDVRVSLEGPVEVDVHQLLAGIPNQVIQVRKVQIYNFKTGGGDRARLVAGYEKTLRDWQTPLKKLMAYARSWLVWLVQQKSFRGLAEALVGKYMAHEIGHMLFLLGRPFGNQACVMRPEPLFNFAKWAKGLDAGKCQIGSSRPMQPGAARINHRPDW